MAGNRPVSETDGGGAPPLLDLAFDSGQAGGASMPMASATLSARVNRRGGAASRRRRSFFLRPVRGSGTDISRPSSARESPILPGRWPVRSWYAGASRSPLCPARTRRAAGRTSGTGPSPVDVGRVGGDIHGIGFPPRPHGSPYLSGRAGRHRCLPSPYRFRRLPGMDRLKPPPAPAARAADRPARSRGARHCADLTTPRCLSGPPAGSTASSRGDDDDQFRPDALCGGFA